MKETADLQDRRDARLKLGANVVVEAGAGTGKTTLLTDRILFLLLGSDPKKPVPVASIAALTFTEKAAGEIKVRLAERLAELSTGAPTERARQTLAELRSAFAKTEAEARALARAALEDLDKAPIGTIHAFASRLLKTYPVEAGVDPGFQVDEGGLFDELFASEWAKWLDAELGEAPPRREDWLEVLALVSLEDLEALARELCREKLDLDGVGRPDPGTADQLERLARELRLIPQGRPAPNGRSKILSSIAEVAAHLPALAAAARAEDLPLPKTMGRREFKASKWPADWDESGREDYERAVAMAEASSPGEEALVRRACRLLVPFARAFRGTFTKVGLISFDGLLRKARDLVRDHPAVREELKRRHAALLIDEFQDTDPLQGELLMFLAEGEGRSAKRWQDAVLAPGKLFVVGDPKQSIYRFRGADIAAYQGFTRHILRGPEALACDLKTNFRSPAVILEPVNAVFAGLMQPLPGLQPAYKALDSAREPVEGAGIEFVAIDPPGTEGAPYTAETVQRQEAAWMTRWILDHCGPGGKRRYKDVCVLLRAATPLPAILDAFKAAGIPYAVEAEKSFYGAQEVLDLLNLLRALDDPQDRVALAALLRSPLAGLGDPALYQLARARGLDYRKEPPTALGLTGEDRERLAKTFAFLRRLRGLVGRVALGDLVHAALEETFLLELSARAYHGEQSVSNLLKLARLATAASEERGLTLREFIERAARDMEDSRGEGESALADEHLEAVRVMTVHKAKGLEFPVVFLANASGRIATGRRSVSLSDWGSARAGLRLPGTGAADAAMAWLEAQEEVRQGHEVTRLLYVALTRAKERLFVLGKRESGSGSLAGRLASVGAWPAAEGPVRMEGCAQALKTYGVKADAELVAAGRTARAEDPAQALPAAEGLAALWKARVARLEEARGRHWTKSPTDYLKEAPKRPARDEESRGSSAGSLAGQLCHRVLETWDFSGGGDVKKAVLAASRLLAKMEPAADWEPARAEASEVLSKFLSSETARELATVEIMGREVPFVYEEGGSAMRGSIDLLYRQGGKVFVADYKSERVAAADVAGRRDKYRLQGEAYCAAVEKALGLKGVGFKLIFLRAPELSA